MNAAALTSDVSILGNAGANLLTGGSGHDTLDGGAGNDTMRGGAGNDSYVVNATGDVVDESVAGSNGTDTVLSSVTYTLNTAAAAGIENLTLTGTTAINATGNALANTLTGNAGNNSLTGNDGDDTLEGGAGNDTLTGGNGSDRASYTTAAGAVTVSLALTAAQNTVGAGTDTLATIENLTGSAFGDTLTGSSAANRLNGGNGNDTLTGGAGADLFVFSFALNATSNRDTITDFVSVDDTIELARSIMTGLGPVGTLSAADFRFGANITTAGDASDRIIYNTATGALYYDADGDGAGAAVQFAQVTAGTVLTAADFFIF